MEQKSFPGYQIWSYDAAGNVTSMTKPALFLATIGATGSKSSTGMERVFGVMAKRLEKGTFSWPEGEEKVVRLRLEKSATTAALKHVVQDGVMLGRFLLGRISIVCLEWITSFFTPTDTGNNNDLQ